MAEPERLPGAGLELAVRLRPGTSPGRALVMLHGWPGTGGDWQIVFDTLAADDRWSSVTLLAPDLRGYGASGRPPVVLDADEPHAGYSPAAHRADLAALFDHLALDQVVVAAYDLGANLAQGMAHHEPNRVRGLVLCDPVHPAARAAAARLDLSRELWYQQLHVQPWAAALIGHDRATVEIYLRHFYTHWWGEGAVDEGHFQAVVDTYAAPGAFEASIGWYRARASGRSREAALAQATPSLEMPVAVLWGERDPVTPVMFAGSAPESFADCTVERLPGVGHFVPLEAPAAVVAAARNLLEGLGWLAG